jgi:hypothetical protein
LTEEVRKGGNALDLLLRKAKSTPEALDVELTEAEEAKSAPVLLSAGSLAHPRGAACGSACAVVTASKSAGRYGDI